MSNVVGKSILNSLLVTALMASFAAPSANANLCSSIFAKNKTLVAFVPGPAVDWTKGRVLAYPKGVSPEKTPDGHFEFAYESEYTSKEVGKLLQDYAPAPNVVAREAWDVMSEAEKVAWFGDRYADKPAHAYGSGLFYHGDKPWMPRELLIDATGNAEIVLDRVSTFGEWAERVDWIVERYEPGSQQAMMSKPREAAYLKKPTQREVSYLNAQHKGWLIYTNLADMVMKIKSGYIRYLQDPTKLTLLSFDHPFVGPMNRIKRDMMEDYIIANAELKKYDDASKNRVRKSDASFKYTGGPSYRPDIAGPDRWAWELRNSHKDVKDLKRKVYRDAVAHANGLDRYMPFALVPAFDSVRHFDRMPKDVQALLKTLFPSKADPRFQYEEQERRVLEVYRNFSMPMQDFRPMAKALLDVDNEVSLMMYRVQTSQQVYMFKLTDIARDLNANRMRPETAKAKVMGAVAEFYQSSGIVEAFENKAAELAHDGGTIDPVRLRPFELLDQSRK